MGGMEHRSAPMMRRQAKDAATSDREKRGDQVLTQNSYAKVDRDDDDVSKAGQDRAIITGSRIPLE